MNQPSEPEWAQIDRHMHAANTHGGLVRLPEVISRPRIVAWMRRSFAATYLILAGRLAAQTR